MEETSIETQAVKSDDSTTTESSNEGTSKVEYASEHLEKYQEQGVNFEEYDFVWGDEFEGDQLNRDDWNVELHEPGWVNEEWQEYIDDEKVLQVNDGKLVIQPVKESVDGKDLYYSGRVNTQNKQNFKYGFFEAKVRVPKGQGYLPAFWLMSADENVYGQWPRCGEIDIMEVHGSDTTKSYGTIHYGNPHRESQGEMQLTEGDFSEEYHVFALEWLPGKINWFVDGQLIHSESEWYSKTEGQGEITYPAPFDSEFYVILNLAVGGSWLAIQTIQLNLKVNPMILIMSESIKKKLMMRMFKNLHKNLLLVKPMNQATTLLMVIFQKVKNCWMKTIGFS
ncbi:glycoside hydrolase family 16 protein [Globicatella sanguinis]